MSKSIFEMIASQMTETNVPQKQKERVDKQDRTDNKFMKDRYDKIDKI